MKPSEITIKMMEDIVKAIDEMCLTPQERKIKQMEDEIKRRQKRHYKWKIVIEHFNDVGQFCLFNIEESEHHVSEEKILDYILHVVSKNNITNIRNITKIRLAHFVED